MRLRISTFCILLSLLAVVPAAAKTGYVTDQLVLTLRSAPNNQSEVIDHLRTGKAMEILAEEGKYLKVRTAEGKEGFVQKQYVSDQLPKARVIAGQKNEIAKLRKQIELSASSGSANQQMLAELEKEKATLESSLEESLARLDNLTREHQELLDASENLLQTTRERDQLLEENNRLAAEAASLRDENTNLLTTGSIKWFLAGSGVLFFGWFMGKVSRKKRRPF